MQITRESFENNLKYSEQYYINKTFQTTDHDL